MANTGDNEHSRINHVEIIQLKGILLRLFSDILLENEF